jgi:CDP-diacylglycerol--serine O-phosphatidyltransferase
MVSTFRYWSFKEVDFAKRHPVSVLLVAVLGALIVATHPQLFGFALFAVYVLSGPARRLLVRKKESATAPEPKPDEPR